MPSGANTLTYASVTEEPQFWHFGMLLRDTQNIAYKGSETGPQPADTVASDGASDRPRIGPYSASRA